MCLLYIYFSAVVLEGGLLCLIKSTHIFDAVVWLLLYCSVCFSACC